MFTEAQERVWETVVEGIKQQGRFAVDQHGRCQYWEPATGHRCAIGLLASEMFNEPGCYDDTPFYDLPVPVQNYVAQKHGVSLFFLHSLQYAHDRASASSDSLTDGTALMRTYLEASCG